MAYRVPKFGAWEGVENFTSTFDGARATRTKGQKINPNDPEDNPEMFRQNAPSQNRAGKQRKQTKVPHFGAWENGESAAGYTLCFENARINKNGGPSVVGNEPQINRDMPPRSNPSYHAQAQAQARPAAGKPETREGRSKVPKFGDWESEGGGGYTTVFEKLQKQHETKSNVPCDVGIPPQEDRAKAPAFGAWDEGEVVQYTDYLRGKNLRPKMNSTEPQLNRDLVQKARPLPPRTESKEDGFKNPALRQGKQSSEPRMGPNRGNQAGSIPPYGGWTNDPKQAEGYTEAFAKAKEERKTPPPSYQHHTRHTNQQQPSCCTIL